MSTQPERACNHLQMTPAASMALQRLNRIRSAGPPFRPEDVDDAARLWAEVDAGQSWCTGEHTLLRNGVEHRSADGETWWDPTPDPETYGYDYDALVEDPSDMPSLANALRRVQTYVEDWGDGEVDPGLHTRDLAVLLAAVKAGGES